MEYYVNTWNLLLISLIVVELMYETIVLGENALYVEK